MLAGPAQARGPHQAPRPPTTAARPGAQLTARMEERQARGCPDFYLDGKCGAITLRSPRCAVSGGPPRDHHAVPCPGVALRRPEALRGALHHSPPPLPPDRPAEVTPASGAPAHPDSGPPPPLLSGMGSAHRFPIRFYTPAKGRFTLVRTFCSAGHWPVTPSQAIRTPGLRMMQEAVLPAVWTRPETRRAAAHGHRARLLSTSEPIFFWLLKAASTPAAGAGRGLGGCCAQDSGHPSSALGLLLKPSASNCKR